ncbi:phosphoesterase [Labrys miyagiensis]|uniref:Phosphoesterase n=1 Tax=Labrys miyagiensis TaxID=346912 RepID=A0ABQ6CDV4_9HYPH|nr:alkaline phosphatase family protein [Labrys miyagiensis]GLS18543.1 phosphoesterase [Labrys miyagiensis]
MDLQFEHVVVLMLENRSFDHLFGYLGKGEGVPPQGFVNTLRSGGTETPFTTRKAGDFIAVGQGPSHSLKQTNEQLFGVTKPTPEQSAQVPPMTGFVQSFYTSLSYDLRRHPTDHELQQVMNCFDPVQIPVLSELARSFVLCDHWFSDVPGPTMPNRAFVHAATSQGYTYNADWKPKFTCKTIYDRINADPALSWRVYSHDEDDVHELYPDLDKNAANHVPFEVNFTADVADDRLATYSFITPAFIGSPQHPVNSMHAPADIRPAEKLVADIYQALKSAPEVWKKTLFIIVFDECGGYFDHVPPPACVSPDGIPGRTDESFLVPFDFQRLGLRVPTILVSPWLQPGLDSTVYSHSTIPGSIIEAFQLPGGFLTKRDEMAAKLTAKYLVRDAARVWREDVPDLVIPVQPTSLDDMQRELLNGSVNLDPHPEQRNTLRTQDIQDPAQAKAFIRTQYAKHMEHFLARRKIDDGAAPGSLTTDRALPSTMISPARVAELVSQEPKRGLRP